MSESKSLIGNQKTKSSSRMLVYGEVLFDCFPDSRRVLGGAPFNVAWGLQGFGHAPYFMSAVGKDADGVAIRETMREWGMRSDGLQEDADHATGHVEVTFNESEPEYSICEGRAWDYISAASTPEVEFIYHGSLVLRNQASAQTFEDLVDTSKAKRFFDVNLRAPYYSKALLAKWLKGADWVKLNIDELAYVMGINSIDFNDAETYMDTLRSKYSIANVLLTAGSAGAVIKGSYGHARISPAVQVDDFQDTVGAGDAFTAVTLAGILASDPVDVIINRAAHFAAKVCGMRGATTDDRNFYQI